MSHIKQLKDFRIPFETINDSTKNFAKENFIGKGGYGDVYKGILSWAQHKNKPVAVKRLNETSFQGNKEFYTEITMLSQFQHKNIIALVGFCDKGKEMIIVYEYATRGSLDKYLTNAKLLDQLSWKRRLKICIGIASALEYLHNHFADQHRVIHRDMKCANILLDDNWKPKLSDFGLSRIGLANQQNTFLITNVAGTHGYCDPQYERTGILTKESDVYSFGVVLFEVLCGRLVYVMEYNDERRFLHHLVRTYYKNRKLEMIVDYRIMDHIKGTKLRDFSAIAYQCLQETREERPPINEVVLQLKKLKDTQKDHPRRRLDTRQFDSNGNSVASQTSNMSIQNKLMKLFLRDHGNKTKSPETPSGQQGSGSPWSLIEDQALVVLVHDMDANWELISDVINSTLQFKCISRNSKECKERHKILMGNNSGDGADSTEDSGLSQRYPSALPGIPKGSARQLFERLQGPAEENTLKSHFEKIIMIWHKPHYKKTQDNQDLKQLRQLHGSHILALSKVCPNNLNGGPILTPLDLCKTISPSPEFIPVGYQGSHTAWLPVPNHGTVAPMVPGSSPASSKSGSSASGPLSLSLRDGRYGITRAGSLSIDERRKGPVSPSILNSGSGSGQGNSVRLSEALHMRKVVVGSLVWVEDTDNAWIDGEVIAVTGEEIKVASSSGKTVVAKSTDVYPKDAEAPPCGVDDMTKLAYLHEPGVLNNLRSRYEINEIYTYTGSILIAVNPFTRLPHLYDSYMMQQYKGTAFGELSPHPFAVADAAYRVMINEGISQSILASGESGAGKTESTKQIMRYLAYIGGRDSTDGRSVEQKVLESYAVLEAFGNAKTVRNNNSSRFCKFVEIQFDEKGRISGTSIRTYLLERFRVCQLSDPERNYHCFYMLCAAPPEVKKRYKVGDPKTFHYLNQSSCYKIDGLDEQKKYIATKNAMDVVGINSEEQDAIFRVVAVILHLGNIEFTKGTEMDSSIPKDKKSWFHLKTAAELFMCDVKLLEDSLCKRVIVTRDKTITKELDPEAAAISRDALAEVVYSRLFDWLVDRINSSIGQDPRSKCIIRVLDIYGFENFKTNSFEQFCIDLTNEELQQHFIQHVFKMEQEEYTKEEINWSYIEFIDNQDILDLIEKKPGGIIALLDEARSTHDTFAQKLYQTFNNHQRFMKPKLARSNSTICHYAGDVTYQTELFLDKNKDYVIAEHQALLSASKCSFVASLFPTSSDECAKSSKFSSIGTGFTKLLQQLLETLSSTEPHYICCVKPNNILKPAIFENHNVLQQLRFGGVLEAIRISCAGYPTRKPFDEFVERFGILAPDVLDGNSYEIRACMGLLQKAGLEGYQIGKTKVFLRAGQMAELDACRTEVLGKSASIIQRKVRSFIARKSFILLRRSVLQLQSICRGQLTQQVYESMRREASCIRIQRNLHENVDALIECVMKDIGFSKGKPVAAYTIYKCLLHWKSFEVESTSVFYCLIQMIGSAIEDQNNEHMAYWLSNASTLLFLLQRSIKSDIASIVRKPPPPTSLFGRMKMGFRSSPSTVNLAAAAAALEVVRQVEAKYPALLFEQQLTAYVEKMCGIIRDILKKELGSFLTLCIQGFRSSSSTVNLAADAAALEAVRQFEARYPALLFKQQLTAYVEKICGIIRDNLKKELGSFLTLCIQAPRATKGVLRSGRSFGKDSQSNHWQGIIDCLNTFLNTLKENFVPPKIVQKIFIQNFSYINVQLFNSLLLRRECCTFSNGEYVKAGLAELELWCAQAKEEYVGSAWDELKHIRQAVGFLVIHKKCRITYDEIINDLCPILSVQQLYRICTLYWDDHYNTLHVSPDVISSMRVLTTEDSNNAASSSFLLDDNSSIPFSIDDLSSSLQVKDFTYMKPGVEHVENRAFQF